MPCLALAPLAVAALGSWTYAGFVADPPPTVVTPAALARTPDRPAGAAVPPTGPSAAAVVAATAPPPATRKPPAIADLAAPPRYRLADATGQVWEHTDPAWLQDFVAARNAQWTRPLVRRPVCPGGTCR